MTIGGSVALIIIGAILRFAITWTPQYVNIQAMGVILMLGGIVGLGISLALLSRDGAARRVPRSPSSAATPSRPPERAVGASPGYAAYRSG